MESRQGSSKTIERLQQSGKAILPWSIIVVVVILAGVLLVRILFSSVEIGSPATESASITRTNERLLEMVKWTVSTILLVGGGLIGFNWYSSEQRYKNDRANDERRLGEMEHAISEFRRATGSEVQGIKSDAQKLRAETNASIGRLQGLQDDIVRTNVISRVLREMARGNHNFADIFLTMLQDRTVTDVEKEIIPTVLQSLLANRTGPFDPQELANGFDQTPQVVEFLRSVGRHDNANALEMQYEQRIKSTPQ